MGQVSDLPVHGVSDSVQGQMPGPGDDLLMLKKLEPMIQLNSQEATELTELHPVTSFEQGRRGAFERLNR